MVDLLKRAGKSCAVVGSSPTLLGKGLGNDIDAHDLVLRFNQAVVAGAEADKGSRTDVRIIGGRGSIIFYEDCDEIVLAIVSPHKRDLVDSVGRAFPMQPLFLLRHTVCHAASEFMHKWRASRHFSSGQLGSCVALQLCEHIDFYGFGVPNRKGEFPGTYHAKSEFDSCKNDCKPSRKHPWFAEHTARKRLGKKKMACIAGDGPKLRGE